MDGILAARNAALNTLNAAQATANAADNLVEGAMQSVNTAGNAGMNSAQMAQAQQALLSAYRVQSAAYTQLINAQLQWNSVNSAALNGVHLLSP
jgi:hypothetical protein